MMRVQNETHAVEALDPERLLRKQEATIRDLRQERLMRNALTERGVITYDPFTGEQRHALKQQLERYVQVLFACTLSVRFWFSMCCRCVYMYICTHSRCSHACLLLCML